MKTKPDILEINRKIVKVSIISVPGPILLALGLLGKFGSPEEIPFGFLNNTAIVDSMLVVGGVIWLWSSVTLFRLIRERGKV